MNTAEIRQKFLDYFEKNRHQVVASSSLVPADDPSLLFTNAGMVQFKDVFLGREKRSYVKAVSTQRCVRAGGKHNDLENVGYTARHHTFFEMLGNFSFGDYFKKEAIHFAWDFLTNELGIDPGKLWITVYSEDEDAANIWLNGIGVDPQRFTKISTHDNFWSMGDVGPCGPCSEIFYDHGAKIEGGPPGSAEEDGDRYVEIWNLVFMQFNRDSDGNLNNLPKPSVDTGMGLERIAAVLQGVTNNYDIDLFDRLTRAIANIVDTEAIKISNSHHSVRVIADHIRSASFLISDGVLPSKEGRGYVLRRIIRRAVRHGHQLGCDQPFFYRIVESLVDEMATAYPELKDNQSLIEATLKAEEEQFAQTLANGLEILQSEIPKLNGKMIPGELVFLLYDTYGFPIDLTADIAREHGLDIDNEGYEKSMAEQRARARKHSNFEASNDLHVDVDAATDFQGYETLEVRSKIVALLSEDREVEQLEKGGAGVVIVEKTPFYAEGGGQVGDLGRISSGDALFNVSNTKKTNAGVYLHAGNVVEGCLHKGEEVLLRVKQSLRRSTAANHTATHLLHAALKQVLGDGVAQKGSKLDANGLRFDFSHPQPLSAEERRQVEDIVNQLIQAQIPVMSEVMPLDMAKAAGAEALFGEKYDDQVRVIKVGDASMELCGGTHVGNSIELGLFTLISESSVASGVRRLEAKTGMGAMQWLHAKADILDSCAHLLKVNSDRVLDRITLLNQQISALENDKKLLQQSVIDVISNGTSASKAVQVGEAVVSVDFDTLGDKDSMRQRIDKFRDQNKMGVIVLAAKVKSKPTLMAGVSKALSKEVSAADLIRHITEIGGGRGGGRADLAEGGVADAELLQKSLDAVLPWLKSHLPNN